MVQIIRNQIKAHKIPIERNEGTTIQVDSTSAHMVATTRSMAVHIFDKRQDSTTTVSSHFVTRSLRSLHFRSGGIDCLLRGERSVEGVIRLTDYDASFAFPGCDTKLCRGGARVAVTQQ